MYVFVLRQRWKSRIYFFWCQIEILTSVSLIQCNIKVLYEPSSILLFLLVLSRIKLSFTDILIRLEHVPQGGHHGVGLELHIDKYVYLNYFVPGFVFLCLTGNDREPCKC